MVSPRQLLALIESTIVPGTEPDAAERMELICAIRDWMPSLKALLSYPAPKPSDRAQVQSKEVRLPDSVPVSLDDQDVQIALKLSDDLHLNEVYCVHLLISANQEWGLLGREPLDVFRLAAGLWYTERRDLLMAIFTLIRAVVFDHDLGVDLFAYIQSFVEDLFTAGLRHRLILLIKELQREDPTGVGGPNSENYILDARSVLVERKAVVSGERVILGHCLVLSVLVERANSKDVKDIFFALKDCARDYNEARDPLNHQILYSLLFSLVIAFTSDALGTTADKLPVLAHDVSFRREFHEIIMVAGNDPVVEGFVNCVRLAWVVHLILVQDESDGSEISTGAFSNDMNSISSCLEAIFTHNVFQFWLDKILLTAAFQNEAEDMVYMYFAYLHKLMACFLSYPLAREKVKEAKEEGVISPYYVTPTHSQLIENGGLPHETLEVGIRSFISLLEFVSEIYKNEPELLSGNDVIWTFVKFAGEDHTSFYTLVAFLEMLSVLAGNQEGASKVFELLQGKTFRSVGWSTLFDCLSIYEEKNKQVLQSPGAIMPEFQEGDAKALMAYLNVLKQVVKNGSPHQKKNWFPDIEPLFKLLGYENVPPYLKGALRDAIAVFVGVSPVMKDTIWRYLEQYDLPVVFGGTGHIMDTQVYDMRFELNEIEARSERYPSTISFINLLNTLIAEERDVSDRGRRFVGIFRFIYDHVFSPFPQRAYADPCEKWKLLLGCLKHFQMMLSMYDVNEDDSDAATDQSQISMIQSSLISMQLPVVEIMKDFMSGKALFRNSMSIILPGVNFLITERTNQIYGKLIEEAILLSLEIIVLVMEKDLVLSDLWRPLYQPLDVILSQDHSQIIALLEYVRYDFQPQIQRYSIKIMNILSARMVGLSQLLLKSNYANGLTEDYATCLELRSEECQIIEDSSSDSGLLIIQLLIENINRPAPNITHLLLKFDVDGPIERTVLAPKSEYSCLKVILDILDNFSKPDVNALLHEFGFQLLYELCVDPLTSAPMANLLCNRKYQFFVKHLNSVCAIQLPNVEPLRISSLHQRAWLLKLLSFELHSADMADSNHRNACQCILTELFGQKPANSRIGRDTSSFFPNNEIVVSASGAISKNKVLEMLELIRYKTPDVTLKTSQFVSTSKYSSLAEDILSSSTKFGMGIYYNSERGDRLIDLASFRDRLWQKCSNLNSLVNEVELNEVREAIQQLLRWGWKYNKNLEEQAAQLHMSTGWCQIVEVSVSQRISLIENQTDVIFQLLDTSLDASGSPDCSLMMSRILTQVALTCMAKLLDDRFALPRDLTSDTVTYLDILVTKQLSNGACHSILFKLVIAILRYDSSEALRRRQYALLLSYLQYCRHTLDSEIPGAVLQFLSVEEPDEREIDLEKIDKNQADLESLNFAILRKEGQPFLERVTKDATQGSELMKTVSLYVLDALIRLDREKVFLSQLQSRGFLRTCLMNISNFSYQDGGISIDSMQHLCTLEAELLLLLRISHKYGKSGLQVLTSMGSLQHISSCRALHLPVKGQYQPLGKSGKMAIDFDKKRLVVAPIMRYLFSVTSLVDISEFFEVKNKVVRESLEFIKGNQMLFDQILQEDPWDADELTLELIHLVVSILTKVWPYEESDEYGFIQRLFAMMRSLFCHRPEMLTSVESLQPDTKQEADLSIFRLRFSLSSYLYFLVTKKSLKLPVADGPNGYHGSAGFKQPTMASIVSFLGFLATALDRAAEEKYVLLNKIKDINELSRQEVDQIIDYYVYKDYPTTSENIQKRRCIAVNGMCKAVKHRTQLIILLLLLTQNIMNIILAHFQDRPISHGTETAENSLCGELIPVLERLELVNEDKTGHDLKIFYRFARSLKEMSIQRLSS